MGAWGHGSFENDDALDWLAELQQGASVQLVEEALVAVAGETTFVEAPVAATALAAAEVVAALAGYPSPDLPGDLTSWVAKHSQTPQPRLLTTARQAVERILTDSELKDLWEESDDSQHWIHTVQDLQARLELSPPT